MTKRQVETQFPLKAKVKWISAHEFFHFMQQVVFSNKVEGFKQVRLASNFVLSTSVYKVGRFPITIFYFFLFFKFFSLMIVDFQFCVSMNVCKVGGFQQPRSISKGFQNQTQFFLFFLCVCVCCLLLWLNSSQILQLFPISNKANQGNCFCLCFLYFTYFSNKQNKA